MNNQAKCNHTPGPWRAEGITIKAVDHGKWFTVGRAYGPCLTMDGNHANAHLIAAAPELLEALEKALSVLDDTSGDINPERGYADELEGDITAAINQARAAIAKAEGASA